MSALVLTSLALVILASAVAWLRVVQRRVHAGGQPAEAPRPVLDFERVREIRQAAEEAALQVALGRSASGRNPFAARTRESVLWTTSFNARLMEFETEAFAPAPAVAAVVR